MVWIFNFSPISLSYLSNQIMIPPERRQYFFSLFYPCTAWPNSMDLSMNSINICQWVSYTLYMVSNAIRLHSNVAEDVICPRVPLRLQSCFPLSFRLLSCSSQTGALTFLRQNMGILCIKLLPLAISAWSIHGFHCLLCICLHFPK